MNILIDIAHPAHVHLFRNFAKQMEENNHKVYFSVRDIPIAKHLLKSYGFEYYDLGKKRDTLLGKALVTILQDIKLLFFVLRNKINYGISSGVTLSHVSKLTCMKSFLFDDDDDNVEPLVVKYGHPFANTVFTPSAISRATKRALYYDGCHELAYLHPNVFTPDVNILNECGIKENDKFFILRFVAFKGHHDLGGKGQGITFEQKKNIIELLKPHGRVIITSEKEIEPEFEEYRLPVSAEKIHSLMAYATMFIGDSQTMTTEAALLGVPSLKCNTFAGKLSIPNEIEDKYDLCYSYLPENFDKMYNKIVELLNVPTLKSDWLKKRNILLEEKVDVTKFITWFVENYPESKQIMKDNPDYQYRFK